MKLIEKGFLKRNKNVLLLSLAIFLMVAIMAAVVTFLNAGDSYGIITDAMFNSPNVNPPDLPEGLDSLSIFVHNAIADFIILFGGLLFSVVSVIVLIINAVSIGSPFGFDFTFACVTILPHGITEYAATVLSFACALNITRLEIKMIKNRSFKSTLINQKVEIMDIIVLILMVIILLFISAIIEGNLTVMVAKWYFGFI